MKTKVIYIGKTCLFIIALCIIANTNSYCQYLPLTGGTLTGNLTISSGLQIETPYLGFNAPYPQPSTSVNVGLFPNSTSSALDIVGWTNGWRFIPTNGSSYLSPVVTIDQSGNTTIAGNIYLAKNLQIGTQSSSGSSTPLIISLGASYSTTAGANPKLKLYDDGANPYGFGISSSQLDAIIPSGTNYAWFVGGSEKMILNSAGNLGIGTTSPQTKMDINGCLKVGSNLDPGYNNISFLANTGQMLMGWNRTAGSGEADFISNQGAGSIGGFAFYNHDNSNNETQLMWVQANGNVLIGTPPQTNYSYKLNVTGNVRASAITVNTTGADFVFKPAYRLLPLADLKSYINKNHHLPEIASAKEMQTNGLNLGDNQTKLLQKVEELTLYLIEKDKQVKKQQQQIDLLIKQVSELSKEKTK